VAYTQIFFKFLKLHYKPFEYGGDMVVDLLMMMFLRFK